MNHIGFAPVACTDALVLILGTLPGKLSLERKEYYAQPRNLFWPVMGEILGFSPDLPYAARVQCLQQKGIALWDVCAAGHRNGSLDSRIEIETVVPNHFADFFKTHPQVGLICFNGAKAEVIFCQKVIPNLAPPANGIPRKVLPSTSPAHAAMPREQKRECWQAALSAVLGI